MADIDEKMASNLYKMWCVFLPTVITAMDTHFLTEDVQCSSSYVFLRYGITPPANANPGYTLMSYITLVFIVMFVLQCRIEIDRLKFRESNSLILRLKQTFAAIKVNPQNADDSNTTYKIQVIRLIFTLASLVFFWAILSVFFPDVFNVKYVSLASYVFLSSVCPGIFIVKHPVMMNLLTTKYGSIKVFLPK